MRNFKNLIIVFAVMLLSACGSTTQVPLVYSPQQGPSYRPLAVLGEVKDDRKYKGVALGAVRNGFGENKWIVQLDKPAADVVRDAVIAGLKSRNMLTTGNPLYVIKIDIIKLDCNKYAHREAHAEWNVTMVNRVNNQTVYAETITADEVDGSIWDMNGPSTEVNNLKDLSNKVLQEAVDRLLNDQNFTAKFH